MKPNSRRERSLWLLPYAVVAMGVLLTAAGSYWETSTRNERSQDRFDREASAIEQSITAELNRYEAMGASIEETVRKPDGTRGTTDDFHTLVSSLLLDSRFPGTFGIAWGDSIPTESLETFLANGMVPVPQLEDLGQGTSAGKCTIVSFAEPDSNMSIARGVNAMLFPPLEVAIGKATDSGETAASDPFKLPLREGPDRDNPPILMFLVRAVYSSDTIPATIEERRSSLVGVAGIALDARRFIPAVLGTNGSRYAVSVHDQSKSRIGLLGSGELTPLKGGRTQTSSITSFGFNWKVQITEASEVNYGEQDLSTSYLLTGLALTALVGCIVFLLTRSERRALRRVQDATAELSMRASHDALTGLVNRAELMHRLDLARENAAPGAIGPTLFFLDLDRFKIINDTLGHRVGDEILIEVGRRLRAATRDQDTVARLGGDEFVVMVLDFVDNRALEQITERLQHAFRAPIAAGGQEFQVSASIGIARATDDDWTPTSIIHESDVAMYDAKHRSPGTTSVFEGSLGRRASDRLAILQGLTAALQRDEFSLDFQPIERTADRSLLGYEAMLRWDNPERGRLAAGEFIELAEESGALIEIGEWVLHEACRCAAAWNTPEMEQATLWVNIATKQLLQPNFSAHVLQHLADTGFSPHRLRLEISDHQFTSDEAAVASHLTSLREAGVLIAIDDFGNGRSTFGQMRDLPVDILKLGASFMTNLGQCEQSTAIAQTMIEFAHVLQLQVVAVGVETQLQAQTLVSLGCDAMQGWEIGRPAQLPATAGNFARP